MMPVTSGVPRSSVPGQTLFRSYILDVDVEVCAFTIPFTGDKMIGFSFFLDKDRQSVEGDVKFRLFYHCEIQTGSKG